MHGSTTGARRRSRVFRRVAIPAALALSLMAVAAAPAAALSSDYPHTSAGNRGVNVKALQHLLRHHGATIEVSAVFDGPTVTAVKAFQSGRGLPVNGHVDQETWKALRVPVAQGDTGEAVIAIQRLLNEKRKTKLDLTGVFGPVTRERILTFQGHAKLPKTGEADPATWRALLAHLELPIWSNLCDYSVGNANANWGTANTIGQLQAAASSVVAKGHGKLPLGDIGYEHGGDIAGHMTHEHGMDVDLRPMRTAKDQCTWGVRWSWSTYDRAATRDLVKAIRATAYRHVKLIYFNDPVLIKEGLTTWYTGHDDHLHVRYCERVHRVALYDC